MEQIDKQIQQAFAFLMEEANIKAGALIVLGCSTSEIGGGRIGKAGSPELGNAVVCAALSAVNARGVSLAVQCCEHLNRALVIEAEEAAARGLARVMAVPHPTAGGSCAAAAYRLFKAPVLVETISADAGVDIGDTLIGMHLRPVAVPVRGEMNSVGLAHLVMAYSRPKYIGGPRALYAL